MKCGVLQDAVQSLRALYALALAREDWDGRLDASADGFLRSFIAPLASLPVALFTNAAVDAVTLTERVAAARPDLDAAAAAALAQAVRQAGVTPADLWSAVANIALLATLFPLISLFIVRRLGGGAGYAALVVTMNWALFWANLFLAVVAAFLRVGLPMSAFAITGFILLGMVIYLAWRAARETLTGEVSLSLMITMLYLLVSFTAGYVSGPIGSALG